MTEAKKTAPAKRSSTRQKPASKTAGSKSTERKEDTALSQKPDTTGQAQADSWEEAMAEQTTDESTAGTEAETPAEAGSAADDWASALAEQDEPADSPAAASAEDTVFKPLERDSDRLSSGARELSMVMDIPVKLNVILGRTRLTIKELLELSEGSVVELDGLAGDPLDILINDYLVAQGEVVVVDDKYGIRITDIITPSERIHKLNR